MAPSVLPETVQFIALLGFGALLLWISARRAAERQHAETARLRALLDRFDPEVLSGFLETESGQEFLARLVAQPKPPDLLRADAIRRALVLGCIGMGCIAVFIAIRVITDGGVAPYVGGMPGDLVFGAAGGLLVFAAAGVLLSIRIINRRSPPSERVPNQGTN